MKAWAVARAAVVLGGRCPPRPSRRRARRPPDPAWEEKARGMGRGMAERFNARACSAPPRSPDLLSRGLGGAVAPQRGGPGGAAPLLATAARLVLLAFLLLAGGARAEIVRLTFLHVNDIYQHEPVNGRGGLAQLDTLVQAERARAPGPVFFTFGGDLISPSLASALTHGAHMVALFNAMQLDVAVLGNHEFDFGPAVAAERIAQSRFPWLGTNVLGGDGQVFGGAVARLVREAGGLRIGFVGALTPQTAELSSAPGITFAPPAGALRAAAAALRAQGADVVVALTHLDLEEDRRIAREVPGIDLLLGGHDHEPYAMQEGGALVVKAGQDSQWLAVVEMAVDREAGRPARIHSLGWRYIPVVDVPPSARLAPLVAAVERELDRALAQPIARLAAPLDSRIGVVRMREAALGDLVADALRMHFQADVGLMNGGGLRGNREYPAGYEFTRRDLLAEMPFGNSAVLIEVTGAALRAALENGLSALPEASGRFPQVSGLDLRYDPAAPAGDRIRAVTVGGTPLEAGRLYRLATTDYIQHGGDGYAMLATARVLVDASGGPLLVNIVAEATQRAGTITAPPGDRLVPVPR